MFRKEICTVMFRKINIVYCNLKKGKFGVL